MNQIKMGVVISYLSMGIGNLISIFYTPIMLRLLGQAQYGLYNFVGSVVAYLGLLNFGLNSSYIRFYVRYHATEDTDGIAKLNGMFLTMYLFISLVILLIGGWFVSDSSVIFGSELSVPELNTARILLLVMVINLAICLPVSVFGAYVVAHEKFVFQKLVELIRVTVSPFLILPILFMGYGAIGMVFTAAVINVVVSLMNIVFCFRKLKMRFIFTSFDFRLVKEIFVFSSFIFLNMIIDQVNWSVDKYILGRVRGTVSVAVYSIAANLNQYYITFSTAISSVFTTRINKMVSIREDNVALTELFIKIGRIQFVILSLLSTGMIIFGKPFIEMWAGKGYSRAYYVLLLLIIPETVPLIQNIGLAIQRAKNMHKFRSIVYFGVVLINIGISIPLAKAYGEVGAAFGTFVSIVICPCLIMNWYYHKKIGIDIISFWKEILKFIPALILPIILGYIILTYIDLYNIIKFLSSIVCYIAVYGLSMWLLGMNNYEKILFTSSANKLISKCRRST
jgi:O-antigen/teichoic acid export membrane protein